IPALFLEQSLPRALVHEHAQAPPALYQVLVHQLLIAFEDRERIHSIFSRDVTHRRQRVAFLQHTFQDHRHHAVAKLAVDRLTIVPLTVHLVFVRSLRFLPWLTAAFTLPARA